MIVSAAGRLPRTRGAGRVERFPDELRLTKLNGRNWRVEAPYRFRSRLVGTVTVPAGFETDLASVPAAARCWVATDGEWTKPAVVHDWLYSAGARPALPRRLADLVFAEAMAERGVSRVLRLVIYAAVRLGGRGAFRALEARRQASPGMARSADARSSWHRQR